MSSAGRCDQFLSKHRLLAGQYDRETILEAFLGEMDSGLSGQESCLAMIPSYIPVPEKAPKNEKIIVLDAGGTNFRTAIIRFDDRSVPHKEYFSNNSMPGVEKELTKEEFFDRIVECLQPVIAQSRRLGFCFSYPAVIDRQRDGTLLYWTKEVKAPQVVGQKILANIAAALKRRRLPCPERMGVLNDTVAALLAGVSANHFAGDCEYIGFILGTGTNTAYIEKNSRITKETGLDPSGSMAINCETANFDKISRGDCDIAFDQTTARPGKAFLEKMVAGAYLGPLSHRILTAAAAEGLLSPALRTRLEKFPPFGSPFLATVLSGSAAKEEPLAGASAEDIDLVKNIIAAVVDRAALMTALNIAAPIVKAVRDGGKKKFCIAADGSTYYKLFSFRERAERYLADILKPFGVGHTIVQVSEGPIIGTAVAGLT